MNYRKLGCRTLAGLLFPFCAAMASEETLLFFEDSSCVVENSQYHRYEADKGASYNYGSDQNSSEKPTLYRQDYIINGEETRFEGWVNPPANPAVPTRDREKEIIIFLEDHQITVKKTNATDSDVLNTVSLTEDANDMMAVICH